MNTNTVSPQILWRLLESDEPSNRIKKLTVLA
jgi:hypothetical protein